MEPLTRTALKLIVLTGQRVEEILHARWSELDLERKLLDIPPDRIKTGKHTQRGHVLPLPRVAMLLISQLPRLGPYLFPKRGNPDQPMPYHTLSQAVARWTAKEDSVAHFSPRDIRRTVKTGMSKIGVLKEVHDRVQNHALTEVASKHYDRFDYLDHKRAALGKGEWEPRRIHAGRPSTDERRKRLARFVQEPYNDLPGKQLEHLLRSGSTSGRVVPLSRNRAQSSQSPRRDHSLKYPPSHHMELYRTVVLGRNFPQELRAAEKSRRREQAR